MPSKLSSHILSTPVVRQASGIRVHLKRIQEIGRDIDGNLSLEKYPKVLFFLFSFFFCVPELLSSTSSSSLLERARVLLARLLTRVYMYTLTLSCRHHGNARGTVCNHEAFE